MEIYSAPCNGCGAVVIGGIVLEIHGVAEFPYIAARLLAREQHTYSLVPEIPIGESLGCHCGSCNFCHLRSPPYIIQPRKSLAISIRPQNMGVPIIVKLNR